MSLIRSEKREVMIGALGNVMVWYNFALFMPFLPILSKEFFPIEDVSIRSIVSFLAMSIGLFMRPIGSAIFGPIGDKIGRQKAISMSIILMAVPTFCMGIIPNYASIGMWSPILLITMRALQGISLGGEYTAAMVHFVEKAPANKRGFFGSWSDAGSQIGVLLSAQSLVFLHSFFSETEIYSYAWRISFVCAAALLPFAFMIPNNETELKKKDKREPSLAITLLKYKKEIACTVMITSFSAVAFYTLFAFLPYYLVREKVLALKEASRCGVIANFSLVASALSCGYFSDIYKRKPFLSSGMIGVTIIIYFMFFTGLRLFSAWMVVHTLYGFFLGMYYSSRAAFFSEAFPRHIRCTGVSLSLSLSQAIFGGLTPVIMEYCTSRSSFLSVIPMTIVAVSAIFALTRLEDRTGQEML